MVNNNTNSLIDPLIGYQSSGGMIFNRNLNYINLLFNISVLFFVVGMFYFKFAWKQTTYIKNR